MRAADARIRRAVRAVERAIKGRERVVSPIGGMHKQVGYFRQWEGPEKGLGGQTAGTAADKCPVDLADPIFVARFRLTFVFGFV